MMSNEEKRVVVVGGCGLSKRLLLTAALASLSVQAHETTKACEGLKDAFDGFSPVPDLRDIKAEARLRNPHYVPGRNKSDRKRNRANRWR